MGAILCMITKQRNRVIYFILLVILYFEEITKPHGKTKMLAQKLRVKNTVATMKLHCSLG